MATVLVDTPLVLVKSAAEGGKKNSRAQLIVRDEIEYLEYSQVVVSNDIPASSGRVRCMSGSGNVNIRR